MKKITFILFALMCSFGFAQTFTDGTGYDLQNGNGTTAATCGTADELTVPLAVTGVGTLGTVNSIQSVTLNITHTWNGDVTASLQDPSGTVTVLLVDGAGGSGDNFTNVVLIDGAVALPGGATALAGPYAPEEALAGFNTGTIDADGTWNLLICDSANGDIGTLDSWSITFAPTPTCDTPAGIAVAGVTSASADFSWIDVASATLGFEWGVLAPGGDPLVDAFLFSGSTAAAVLTASEAGLSPETDYVLYVRSNCDTDGFSAWSAGTAFTTPPPPPANDNACDAIALNVGDASTGQAYTNVGGTIEAGETGGTCWFTAGDVSNSVWFSFILTGATDITVSTDFAGGSLGDTQLAVFSGDCSDLSTFAEVGCDDDGGAGFLSIANMTGLAAGTYYIQVEGFGGNVGTFDLSVDVTLSVDSLENENAFNYFPNPVKDELTLNAQKDIQNVAVYNMLGQEVIRTAPNAVNSTISMSELSQGAYFVQVTIGNVTEVIRIIKQ